MRLPRSLLVARNDKMRIATQPLEGEGQGGGEKFVAPIEVSFIKEWMKNLFSHTHRTLDTIATSFDNLHAAGKRESHMPFPLKGAPGHDSDAFTFQ